jgi:hypothetical protein
VLIARKSPRGSSSKGGYLFTLVPNDVTPPLRRRASLCSHQTPMYVRCEEQPGKYMLALSSSQFDPQQIFKRAGVSHFSKAVPCVVAALWPLPSTTRGRRQSVGTLFQAPVRLRRTDRLQSIMSSLWGLRRGCLKSPPSPSRKACRAKQLRLVPPTAVQPNSLRSLPAAKTTPPEKWSVRFFSPGWTPQLYSPVTKTNPSALRILSANRSSGSGGLCHSGILCTSGRASAS